MEERTDKREGWTNRVLRRVTEVLEKVVEGDGGGKGEAGTGSYVTLGERGEERS